MNNNDRLFKTAVSKTKLVFLYSEEQKVTLTISVDTHRKCNTSVYDDIERQLNQFTINGYMKQEKKE